MAMTLITTNTSSNAASSSFTSGIDSTYKLFIFKFFDCNPATDGVHFGFQANASSQSGYNETVTTTFFRQHHGEDDSNAEIAYVAGADQAQATDFIKLNETGSMGGDADQHIAGTLWLFNPSNTTYVKHFYATTNMTKNDDGSSNGFISGYFNVTAAITNIQFKMSSGNFDGTIKMYGVG